jgi:hypothetical protein
MCKHHSRFLCSIIFAMMVGLSVHTAYGQKSNKRNLEDASSPASSTSASGANYALVIGNNNYKYVTKLKTAINDANAVAQVLKEQYGFKTTVLPDATRNAILTALNNLRRTLPPESNLLIYYAGHGHHDPETDKAYWLPVDAQKDSNENWISADDISSDVKAIPSQHVLIISDSCYSGVLTRGAEVEIGPKDRAAYLAKVEQSKSRTLMSSGGDEPVTDSGAPGHSIFASAILDSLQHMEQGKFTAGDLFQRFVQPGVAGRSEQLPQYSVIRNSGHAFGDFVFTRRAGPPEPAASVPEPAAPPAATGKQVNPNRANTAAPNSLAQKQPSAQKQSFSSGYQAGAAMGQSGASPGLPQSQLPAQPGSVDVAVQRFLVVHYGADTTQYCVGWLTIQPGLIQYRGLQGNHTAHAFDFPFASIKEAKKNSLFAVNLQGFHIRLSGNDNYNFSLVDYSDVSNPRFLNADALLMALNSAIGK